MDIIVHGALPYYSQHPRSPIMPLSRKNDDPRKTVRFKDVLHEKMKANRDKQQQ
ncbi:hypothetical protein QNH46_18770 [Paenibacillus woosongensis]|uniref:Uncharacterized protein n=1 Tax=Paenibacillus woosongensis TaxID=307580 RepID=A0AA95I0A1_9BACL|nr:hypothetical protein [Paenibacillus woosongensis]WHX48134.1 hypothetical protein QNH46_18770 [Paenibacillus woosongensis]